MNYKMQIATLAKALREKEISSVELTEMCLLKIKEKDSEIGAFLSVLEEKALRQAAQFDACREERKWSSPLAGIPFGVKDNICLLDAPMTCGSKMLMNFTAPYEATVVQKVRLCHAIPLGKTNMDEFGMGSTTEYSAFHVTRNPLSLDRVPGGSSGGSAAAVAAGMVPFALGSDTGGSVRLPASYCGLVGLRPTYGAFSRYGLTAFCSSMDTVGVLTSTVRDNRLVYETMAGVDQNDATSRPMDPCYEEMPEKLRVGILSQLMGEGISDIAIETVERAAQSLARGGHDVFCVSIPSLKDSLFAYFMISSAEASSNLARFDGVRYGYRSPNANDTESMYRQSRSGGFGVGICFATP